MQITQTPVGKKDENSLESTPPAGNNDHMPARAISFKDDSPNVESGSNSKENELFKSCGESPAHVNTAINSLTANIAGTLQTCLTSVLRSTDEETEIQFKFVISKKKVSVKRIKDGDHVERYTEVQTEQADNQNKENIWSTVAKAVKNVFWGSHGTHHTNPGMFFEFTPEEFFRVSVNLFTNRYTIFLLADVVI